MSEDATHSPDWRFVSYVIAGQACFVFFVAVCVATHPGFVLKANEGGMSNYGIHIKTAFPYTLAFALPAFFALRANEEPITKTWAVTLRLLLRCYAALLIATLLTTYAYSLNTILKDLHIVVGAALTLFEVWAAWWMYKRLQALRLAFWINIIGLVIALLTFVGVLHLLFVSQLLIGGAYGALLIASSRDVTDVALTRGGRLRRRRQ